MRNFECPGCRSRGVESRWEHHHRNSFCPACGEEGIEQVDWGCFECQEAGVKFSAPRTPDPPCPQCGEAAVRVLYAPMVQRHAEQSERFGWADKMLKQGIDERGLTDIVAPPPKVNPMLPHWEDSAKFKGVTSTIRGASDFLKNVPKTLPTRLIAEAKINAPAK